MNSAVQLEGIRVAATPGSRTLDDAGFYDRKKVGIGSFLTEEEINSYPGRQLSDVLNAVSGVKLVRHIPESVMGPGMPETRIAARGSRATAANGDVVDCLMSIVVDGVLVSRGSDRSSGHDLNSLPVGPIEGIEVYRGFSQVPVQFRTFNSGCGVVLIWTARGER